MPLRDFLHEFGLDAEAIEADREVSSGLASGYGRRAEELERDRELRTVSLLECATECRRAAAHSVLLSDWKTARDMFEQAGYVYRAAGLPYGLMMFACGRKPMGEALAMFGAPGRENAAQLAYMLLARAAAGQRIVDEMLEPLTGMRSAPMGILGLPARAYLELAEALQRHERERAANDGEMRIERAMLPFLAAYSSAVATARESDWWDSMILPFHPADADTLGVVFCAEEVLRQRYDATLLRVMERVPLGEIAGTILYNAIQEGFGSEEARG